MNENKNKNKKNKDEKNKKTDNEASSRAEQTTHALDGSRVHMLQSICCSPLVTESTRDSTAETRWWTP
jgi:hypothetical protein